MATIQDIFKYFCHPFYSIFPLFIRRSIKSASSLLENYPVIRYVAKVSLAFSKILQCACLCNLKLKENYPDLKFLTNVLSCDQYTYDEFRRMDKRMGEAGAKG